MYYLGIMSKELGRCATYDKDADGYVPSEASVVFILKRLDDALKDGDDILSVVTSVSNTHKGSEGFGITSPGQEATSFAIQQAMSLAGIKDDEVDFVEAHGTGTKAGDAIEAAAIASAFKNRTWPLMIGACKSMLGHTENVATLTSLLKASLAIKNSIVPSTLIDPSRMNPDVAAHFEKIGATVPATVVPWPTRGMEHCLRNPRRAIVMSAGLGGSISTLSLKSSDLEESKSFLSPNSSEGLNILTISAATLGSLRKLCNEYYLLLRNTSNILSENHFVSTMCKSSNLFRTHYRHRIAISGESIDKLEQELSKWMKKQETKEESIAISKNFIFVFPGHGSFDSQICSQLYSQVEAFRLAIEV
jgi:acyl transferase domain-containing protein